MKFQTASAPSAGSEDGQDDPEEPSELAAAVGPAGFEQFHGDGLFDVLAHHEDAERGRDPGHDHGEERFGEPDLGEYHEERQQHDDVGHRQRAEHQAEEQVLAWVVVHREPEAGQRADERGEHGGHGGDDDGGEEPLGERLLLEQVLVVVQGGR